MAEVIHLDAKLATKDNLIQDRPLEFRCGDWSRGYALLCTRPESRRYEKHRLATLRKSRHRHVAGVPNHTQLDNGYHYTALGLFQHRKDEALMRRVYRLAGLMECITSAPSAVLRTDLLRRFYQEIVAERDAVGVVWRGNVDRFLLPLFPEHCNRDLFFFRIKSAQTLKELLATITAETTQQFITLCTHYVIYVPKLFVTQPA